MHVLILEIVSTGHHIVYLERIATGFLDAGNSVTVSILEDSVNHEIIHRLVKTYGPSFKIFSISRQHYEKSRKSLGGDIGRELTIRRTFGKIYRTVNRAEPVNYIFIPYLDYCLYAIGLLGSPFGSAPWGGICMRPSFHYNSFDVISPTPKFSKVKEILFLKCLASHTLKKIYTIDELLHRHIAEKHNSSIKKLTHILDPAELKGSHTYESARTQIGIPTHAKVILVYGSLDQRKGVDAIIHALNNTSASKNIHLLLAGKQSPELKSFLQSKAAEIINQKRCHIIDSFLTEDQQQMVFSACDVVWLGYRNHYTMSGVLVLAGLSQKYVISTENGLIGWHVKNKEIGTAINIDDLVQLEKALNSSFQKKNQITYSNNSSFQHYTWENLLATITQ